MPPLSLGVGVFLMLFQVGNDDARAGEQECQQILPAPDVLAQQCRAEEAGKEGLSELNDKQLRQLAMLQHAVPDAVARYGSDADVGHDPEIAVKGVGHTAAHARTQHPQHGTPKELGNTRADDGGGLTEHLLANNVGKHGAEGGA